MAQAKQHQSGKPTSGHVDEKRPDKLGGDQVRKAQEWGGGSKASKGPVTKADKRNPNSSAKS